MTTMHLDNPRSLNFGKRKRRPHDYYWAPCLNEDTESARKNRLVHAGSFTVIPHEPTRSGAHSAYLSSVKRPKYKHHSRNVSGLGG